MSTPSPNDGNSGEDYYRGGINPNIPPPPPQIQQYVSGVGVGIPPQAHTSGHPVAGQHQAQPPPQFVHWANPLMGGSPFMQHPHPHGPPQQLFNDVLFNIQAQAAYAASVPPTPVPSTPGAQQETYSVLRVGNGNFLKIYHCPPENAMGPMPGETSFTPLHAYNPQPPQQPQPQATAYHHIQQQQAPPNLQPTQQQQQQHSQTAAQQQTPSHMPSSNSSGAPQIFNSYELFSSNTFTQLPTAEMPPVLLLGTTNNSNVNSSEPIAMLEEFEEEQLGPPQQHQTIITAPNVANNWLGNSSPLPPLYDNQYENASQQQMHQAEVEYLAQINQDTPNNKGLMTNEMSEKNIDAVPHCHTPTTNITAQLLHQSTT